MVQTKPAGAPITALPGGVEQVTPPAPASQPSPANPAAGSKSADLLERTDLLRAQMRRECLAMSAYSLSIGKSITPEAAASMNLLDEQFGDAALESLIQLHGELAAVVAPALPGSIAHVYQHAARAKFQNRLAPVPVAREMAAVGLVFVVSFFGIGLFDQINAENLNRDLLSNSGWNLLLVQLFLLSAAGAGACFANLFDILKAVNNMTIMPTFSSEYWVKLALGIIAGLLLSELIPLSDVAAAAGGNAAVGASDSFQKPVIALIGGFSSSILYTILNRLTETMENLFDSKSGKTPGR